jgi:SAM-dependent methyltransferase
MVFESILPPRVDRAGAESALNSTTSQSRLDGTLRPPPGVATVPTYDRDWLTADGSRRAFLAYLGEESVAVNWSESLEELHARVSTHFMDAWTRRVILARLGLLPRSPTVIDIGCSTGYLLEDLHRRVPHATLVGVDPIASGLLKAHVAVPQALLLQADSCALPLHNSSVDVVVSANVLEHVPDDEQALAEMSRVLRPGGRAVIVVPLDPSSYNYFDRVLGHERRYARGELARKAEDAGLRVLEEVCLGGLLYPAFWLVKRLNQRRYGHLRVDALERRVAQEIEGTSHLALGRIACRLEEALLRGGVRMPFGIRGLSVLVRPETGVRAGGDARMRSEVADS